MGGGAGHDVLHGRRGSACHWRTAATAAARLGEQKSRSARKLHPWWWSTAGQWMVEMVLEAIDAAHTEARVAGGPAPVPRAG